MDLKQSIRKSTVNKQGLKLTTYQHEVLVGTILGDAHLNTHNGKHYSLKILHGLSQKVYTDWLYNVFRDWVRTPPQVKNQKTRGKVYQKYWFNTVSHELLNIYGQQFYQNRKKIVPEIIQEWLTPLALAVWFMDDGSIKSKFHRALILNTQCYSDADLYRLQATLWLSYGISTILRNQKEGKQIYILAETVQEFVNIIRPYILPEMTYKLGKLR